MNQPSVRAPMRPSAAVSPMCAMPVTRVANTSGAMIILIRRRKMSVRMVNQSAAAFSRSGSVIDWFIT